MSIAFTLDQAVAGRRYHIVALHSEQVERCERLSELGFLPGETTLVLARGQPGNEPLAVRVGLSTFALRRVEAACVLIREPDAREPDVREQDAP